MIRISICLSDIPESARKKSEKNGKIYAEFIVDERKQPDNYGNTHSVALSQTKEQREAKLPKVYVGNGKIYTFNNNQSGYAPFTTDNYTPTPTNLDDLPF